MIWLNPDKVALGSTELRNVTAISVDRDARRLVEEWTDLGPYASFADVPEQRVSIRIARRILESETPTMKPGDQALLSFRTSAGAGAAGVRAVSASVVITSIDHNLSASGRATQRITAAAVSSTGAADPITEAIVEGET